MRAPWVPLLVLALALADCAPRQRPGSVDDCEHDADCPGAFCDPTSRNCVECFYDGQCELGRLCEEDACVRGCRRDSGCPDGLFCVQGGCTAGCRYDADCQGVCDLENHVCVECLLHDDCPAGSVCEQLRCVAGCQTDRDCPQDLHCLTGGAGLGVCAECSADADCVKPSKPLCREGRCAAECDLDADCGLAGQVCEAGSCVCSSPGCPPGTWCDGIACQPGCDADEDCAPPDLCDPATHACGTFDCCGGCDAGEYCDTITCQCVTRCENVDQCPPGFTCEVDNKCWCTVQACPDYTHCDLDTGDCIRAACRVDADCPDLWACDRSRGRCQPTRIMPEGAFCFEDEDCDTGSGLLCDSSIHCEPCRYSDPAFSPTFTCRYQCSQFDPDCPLPQRECLMRKEGFEGLCLPSE